MEVDGARNNLAQSMANVIIHTLFRLIMEYE